MQLFLLLDLFAKVNRVYRSVIQTADTYDTIWLYKCHSFAGLFNGVHPPLDPYGNHWPEGSGAAKYAGQAVCGGHFRGTGHLFAHDREYGANELGQEHWNSDMCCLWCPADRGIFNVRSVGPHAPWKALLHTPGPHDRRVSQHAIWGLPGASRFSHAGDLMHAGDLGVLGHLHGAAAVHTTRVGGAYVGNELVRADKFWDDLIASYIATNVTKRLQYLSHEMMRGKGIYPFMKTKAAEARHLIKPMIDLLERKGRGGEIDAHLLRAYKHIDRVYDLVLAMPMVPSDEEAEQVLKEYDSFLLHYNHVATVCMRTGVYNCNMTTKFHEVWHILHMGRFLSPRMSWCYSFEDFIGKIKKSAQACVCGTPMHKIPSKVVDNYLRAVFMELEKWL